MYPMLTWSIEVDGTEIRQIIDSNRAALWQGYLNKDLQPTYPILLHLLPHSPSRTEYVYIWSVCPGTSFGWRQIENWRQIAELGIRDELRTNPGLTMNSPLMMNTGLTSNWGLTKIGEWWWIRHWRRIVGWRWIRGWRRIEDWGRDGDSRWKSTMYYTLTAKIDCQLTVNFPEALCAGGWPCERMLRHNNQGQNNMRNKSSREWPCESTDNDARER